MASVQIHSNYFILLIIFLVILLYVIVNQYKDKFCLECIFKKEEFQQQQQQQQDPSQYLNIKPNVPLDFGPNNSMMVAPLPPALKKMDKVYPQNDYPYKADGFYDQGWYPNLKLPFQVIGGGYRMIPTLGGTQIPIMNPPLPIDISDDNIAPNNIEVVNPNKNLQQIGVIYKVFGTNNDIYPLYQSPARRNMNQYNYYTRMGPYALPVPVVTKNKIDQLDTNDVVFLKNLPGAYRVTIYDNDIGSFVSTSF